MNMLHFLSLAMFAFLLFRLILPLRAGRGVKAGAAVLLLLASQQHLLNRHLFGGMASPELPPLVLTVQGWIAATFILLCLLILLRDVLRLCRKLARRTGKRALPFSPGRRSALLALASAVPAAYGVRRAVAVPEARSMNAVLPNLPGELDGLSLVQATDLHISALLREDWVRAVVEKINALESDLILLTGDIVDGFPSRRAESASRLGELRARHGVYACVGNHEYYADFHGWTSFFRSLGINVLLNAHAALNIRGRNFVIAGLTDAAAARYALPGPDIEAALAGAPEAAVRLLLAHRPAGAEAHALRNIDLQLSGHTHGGQIVGLNQIVSRYNQGYLHGWYRPRGMPLYVSSGAGLWSGFPVRLGVPSEIARLVLRAPDKSAGKKRQGGCADAQAQAGAVHA
jgi:predicted MPP superfamily phosphohydrolase